MSGLYRQYRPGGYNWGEDRVRAEDLDLARWKAMGAEQRGYFDMLSRESEERYNRAIDRGDFAGISADGSVYTSTDKRDGE